MNDASLPQSATDTPVRLDNAQGSHPSGSPADTAGVYRLGGQTYAVNRPWPEDMPDQITDEKLHLLLPEASISSMQSAEEAPTLVQEAWKLFLFFALACLLMEALLCLPGQTVKLPSPPPVHEPEPSTYCVKRHPDRPGYGGRHLDELYRLQAQPPAADIQTGNSSPGNPWLHLLPALPAGMAHHLLPAGKPKVSILEDRSGSMETQDVEISPQHVVTRTAYVQELLKGNSTESLKDTHVVEYASFGAPPAPDSPDYAMAGTDLAKPLEDAMQSSDNLRAVIMFTDGSHNASSSVLTQAQRMRTRGIPLFIISAGSPYPLPDLALQDVKAPTYGIIGETVQIPFTIKSTLGKETRATLTMISRDTGKTVTRTVTIPAQGEVSDAVLWKIEKEGAETLELKLPAQPQERMHNNNASSFSISGRRESIKALVIDTLPRWEYRFIRNALYRDPGVNVHTLLFHPELEEMGKPRIPGQIPGQNGRPGPV